MGFFARFRPVLLTVEACRCFAQDPCFEKIKRSFESIGFKWQEELVDKLKTSSNLDRVTSLIMDKAFFLPDRFEILIDARGFRPEDIKCMLTANSLEVSAQKEDRTDNAQKRISLTRQYVLPQNAVPEKGQCCLSSDGMLLVTAPWLR
ncbi:alpha-crystallin A chain-like [Anthonomus grandis grandis]|uniref:alpha-crystallin A chain-like n=1 Tax=Anthonomus grandis grandis TaxID=2921223 RepID=UPI0021656665|nr:alpha-crystallin A chain-like [Anthonomus grandis grandis]